MHNFDYLEKSPYSFKNSDKSRCKIKYLGGLRIAVKFMDLKSLPPELWSKENFTSIDVTFGQVVVPFVVDQIEANLSFGKVGIITSSLANINCESLVDVKGKIIKIGISEVDIDLVPFKSHRYQLDENSSSDDDGNDKEGYDYEDGISDTNNDRNNEELEDGKIRSTDVAVVIFLIPTHIPLPDTEVDSPSSSSEIRNIMEVDNILGFEVDVDNPILKEVLGDDGENQII
ncbi:unnamed protein product [Lactuca saligna]|uniref:DUF4283 domain-containing protein n=1 Tax=Lactuca saligna TaxID=75948 RepID=A0AA36EJL5_LACSI|nr:unnamed protein product [Lactuca saligna]